MVYWQHKYLFLIGNLNKPSTRPANCIKYATDYPLVKQQWYLFVVSSFPSVWLCPKAAILRFVFSARCISYPHTTEKIIGDQSSCMLVMELSGLNIHAEFSAYLRHFLYGASGRYISIPADGRGTNGITVIKSHAT